MRHDDKNAVWLRIAVSQGITAPVLYAGATIIGAVYQPGYSHFSNAVSELSASGAPNQSWLIAIFALTELLKIMFGVGYYVAVRDLSGALVASAVLMVVIGVVGLGFARFPMDQIGAPLTFDGRMHIVIVSISAVLAVAAIAFAGIGWRRSPDGKTLARWSFAMLALMLASGIASGLVAANAWPGIGIWQRVNIGAFSIWQIATSVYLLHRV